MIVTAPVPSARPIVTVPLEFRLVVSSDTPRSRFPDTPSPIPTSRLALDGTNEISPVPLSMFPEIATSAAVMVMALFEILTLEPGSLWVNVPVPSSPRSELIVSVPLVVRSAFAWARVTPLSASRLRSPVALA